MTSRVLIIVMTALLLFYGGAVAWRTASQLAAAMMIAYAIGGALVITGRSGVRMCRLWPAVTVAVMCLLSAVRHFR